MFYPAKHFPKDEKIKPLNGKFKNQLHTYIDTELAGEDKSEFRNLANSAINFVEDSIDFMDTTTHQLDAQKHLAEV